MTACVPKQHCEPIPEHDIAAVGSHHRRKNLISIRGDGVVNTSLDVSPKNIHTRKDGSGDAIGGEIGGHAEKQHVLAVGADLRCQRIAIAFTGAGNVHTHEHGRASLKVAQENIGAVVGVVANQVGGVAAKSNVATI